MRSVSPSSSRFPGDVSGQKGREAVGNGSSGDYHWTLVDRNGNSLARSPSFASYEHTEDAARVVLAGAGSARLDRRVGN
jgi:hypothetical protein